MRNFRRSVRAIALVSACVLVAHLKAQDVTTSDPVWFLPETAPDEAAKLKGRLRPDYPDEMRKTDEQGYVIVSDYVSPKGEILALESSGTHVPFQRAVEATNRWKDWSITPGKRDGQAVNTRVWIAVIFNPKSASTDGPDAIPRLLAVTPVTVPKGSPGIIRMRLSLDATGAITKMVHESEVNGKTLRAIRESLPAWRFAPARKNGQPVAAEIVVPVLCQEPWSDKAGVMVPPRVTHQEPPEYPYAMRRFGLRGTVLVDFKVDVEGRVQNAVIAQSNNPAFDEPALKAVRKWKFQPGTLNGKPVTLAERVPIVFDIEGGARDMFEITTEKDQSHLPPEYRYDTAPKLRAVWIPIYPYAMKRDGVTGKARVTIAIDATGHVAAVKVDNATRPEFGLALAAAIEGFSFDPALKDGKAVPNLLAFDQAFNFSELPDEDGAEMLSLEKRHPEKIVGANKLDTPLKPVSRRAPVFPVNLRDTATRGEALIEVLIDEDGHVRLPHIVSATDDAFGYSAVQAAANWMFDPPTVAGKSVNVRVQIPFVFAIKPSKQPENPPAAAESK